MLIAMHKTNDVIKNIIVFILSAGLYVLINAKTRLKANIIIQNHMRIIAGLFSGLAEMAITAKNNAIAKANRLFQ